MNMNRLWAPWRINYIKASSDTSGVKKKKKCIFCLAKNAHAKSYTVFKTKYSISMLNIFPYNNGHMLISPLRHIKELSELKECEVLDLFKTLDNTKNMLEKALKPLWYSERRRSKQMF